MPPDTSRNRYQVNEQFFDSPQEWNEEAAYWFGWLVSDGTNDKRGRSISLKLAESDREQLVLLKRLIQYTGPVLTEKRKKWASSIAGIPLKGEQQDRATLIIYNKILSEKARSLGVIGGKGGSFSSPKINPLSYRHYVRGLFEGDGCFSFSCWNKFESNLIGAPEMLKEIQDWLDSHGIVSHLGDRLPIPLENGAKVLRICGNNTGMHLFLLLYADCQLYLPRKLNAFTKLYNHKKTLTLKKFERESFSMFQSFISSYVS